MLWYSFLVGIIGLTYPNWAGNDADWDKMNLKGNIQRISQRIYAAKMRDNEVKKQHLLLDPLENWDIEFNKKGFISQKNCYGADNELMFYYDYKYKKNTFLIQKTMYDANNYLVEKVAYVYSQSGQLAAESIYRSDGSLLVRYIYNYTPKGLLSQTDVQAPISHLYVASKYEFSYNKAQLVTEQRTYNTQENLHQTDYYDYDNNGHLKTHKTVNHLNQFEFVAYSKYNLDGYLMTYQEQGSQSPSLSYTYIFDEEGNWISRTHYKNGKIDNIVERTITYY